jgi:hypothetical protein
MVILPVTLPEATFWVLQCRGRCTVRKLQCLC